MKLFKQFKNYGKKSKYAIFKIDFISNYSLKRSYFMLFNSRIVFNKFFVYFLQKYLIKILNLHFFNS